VKIDNDNQASRPAAGKTRRLTGLRKLYIAQRCGRTANRLVIYANLIAFAEEHGCLLVNYTFHSYADFFKDRDVDFHCQYPGTQRRSVWDMISPLGRALRRWRLPYQVIHVASKLNERFKPFGKRVITLREIKGQEIIRLDDPELLGRVETARTVFFYGWVFRAPELVQRHAEKIRAHFQPVEAVASVSREAVTRMRAQADIVVGVHVRHGDYRTWKDGMYFYPADQYAAWMRAFAAQFPGRRVAFLVASDEPRTPEEFPGLVTGFCKGSPVADIYSLSGCDYIFGPPSTFSQWASFHGNKPLRHLHSRDASVSLDEFKVSYLAEIP